MASLITKKKSGREYLYWVRSARVNGKPRIVEQVYLGPKDRVLEEIKQGYANSGSGGPLALREVHNKEFGASAVLWRWANEMKIAEIVDRHVPQPPARRRTHVSVGQYLLLATVNRAIRASSKRSLYEDWYRHSVVSRLLKAEEADLTSQRFWDHMDQVEPHQSSNRGYQDHPNRQPSGKGKATAMIRMERVDPDAVFEMAVKFLEEEDDQHDLLDVDRKQINKNG